MLFMEPCTADIKVDQLGLQVVLKAGWRSLAR